MDGKKLIGYHGTTYGAARRIVMLGPSTTVFKTGSYNNGSFYVARNYELALNYAEDASNRGINYAVNQVCDHYLMQQNHQKKRLKTEPESSPVVLKVYGSQGIKYFWNIIDDEIQDFIDHQIDFNKYLPLFVNNEQMVIPAHLWHTLSFSLLREWESVFPPKWFSKESPF